MKNGRYASGRNQEAGFLPPVLSHVFGKEGVTNECRKVKSNRRIGQYTV